MLSTVPTDAVSRDPRRERNTCSDECPATADDQDVSGTVVREAVSVLVAETCLSDPEHVSLAS